MEYKVKVKSKAKINKASDVFLIEKASKIITGKLI